MNEGIDSDMVIRNALAEQAARRALDPREPIRLRATPVWIDARSDDGWVLLGGLGPLGVGQMWSQERDEHKAYSGYASAPIIDRKGATF